MVEVNNHPLTARRSKGEGLVEVVQRAKPARTIPNKDEDRKYRRDNEKVIARAYGPVEKRGSLGVYVLKDASGAIITLFTAIDTTDVVAQARSKAKKYFR